MNYTHNSSGVQTLMPCIATAQQQWMRKNLLNEFFISVSWNGNCIINYLLITHIDLIFIIKFKREVIESAYGASVWLSFWMRFFVRRRFVSIHDFCFFFWSANVRKEICIFGNSVEFLIVWLLSVLWKWPNSCFRVQKNQFCKKKNRNFGY